MDDDDSAYFDNPNLWDSDDEADSGNSSDSSASDFVTRVCVISRDFIL
jgi:hypothetical protein